MDMRVFWAVLAAHLVFTVLVILVIAFGVRFADFSRQQVIAQALVDHESARVEDLRRRKLSSDQRCVGATVVTVDGSRYTQAKGGDGRPVACSGRYAALPLR